jgi:flagellar biosynthesis protein FlhG
MKDTAVEKTKQLRVISITGGKGGIGKTTIAVNLAIAFGMAKKKVLLFDADLGLANVDIRLGLNPEKNLHDFLAGDCSLNDICIDGPHNIKVIPSASGIQKMVEISRTESLQLIHSFSTLTTDIDIMLIDMAPGISHQAMDFTHAAQDILIVICNDPASLMDSYAIIKILHQSYGRGRFGVIVNKVADLQEGYDVFSKFQQAIAKFINVSMQYVGHVPEDDYIGIAAREGVAVVDKFPQSQAAIAFHHLCHGISHWHEDREVAGGIHFFFERLIQDNLEKPCIA